MKVLGITGYMGAGKDTLYEQIAGIKWPGNVARLAFADEIRFEIMEELNGGRHLSALYNKPYSPTVRALMQWWGTDLRRKVDPDYWVDRLRVQIEESARDIDGVVCITDVRYDNEAKMIQEMGGKVAMVQASVRTRAARLGLGWDELVAASSHQSEQLHLGLADYLIDNDTGSRQGPMVLPLDMAEWLGILGPAE